MTVTIKKEHPEWLIKAISRWAEEYSELFEQIRHWVGPELFIIIIEVKVVNVQNSGLRSPFLGIK